MKTLFVIWLILTCFLCLSVIGIVILLQDDMDRKSTWMELGSTLLKNIQNEKSGTA